MNDNTKLLEERVAAAVERLRELSSERDRLQSEVRTLQTRLDRVESEQSARKDESPAVEDSSPGWLGRRAAIVDELKQTIADLRSD
jgi:chromosome segregation ATPase